MYKAHPLALTTYNSLLQLHKMSSTTRVQKVMLQPIVSFPYILNFYLFIYSLFLFSLFSSQPLHSPILLAHHFQILATKDSRSSVAL